jgi:hypothetical protein
MAEIRINATGELKLYDSDDSNYVSFKSGGTVSSNVTWTLPTADGSNGQALTTDGSGTLSWATASSADPSSADGDSLGTASAEWSDLFLADGGTIQFGNDQEVRLIHTADTGLILKHTATADDKPISLTLQTGETDIAQDDVIGKIDFQAPDEGTGTDAILVAAGIEAVSEGDFSSSNNATKLSFKTAASEAAAEKMSLSSAGLLTVTGGITMTGTTPTLTIGDAGAEDTKIVFDGNAQDWHIGLDDSADDLVIGLGSTLGTTSHIVIDEAGHVTMPLQSAALFYSSNDTQSISSGANRTIAFNAEKYDLNGDYNTGTYTFTAPIAGRYLIQCHVSFNGGEITTNTRNNVGYSVGGTPAYRQFGSSTGSNDRFSMGFSVVQELAASNAVTFIVHLESDDCDLWMESSPEKFSWGSVTLLC